MIEVILIIFLFILSFVAIIADIIIFCTIFRFKRLRNAFNVFLANWAIADLLTIISVPIFYAIYSSSHKFATKLNCISLEGAIMFHVTEILFGIVLSLDWCFAAYFQNISKKFRKHYRYVIASIWLLTLLFCGIATSLCSNEISYFNSLILFGIIYSISLIFVITLQCSRIAQKCRKHPVSYPKVLTLRLTLITIIIVTYLIAALSMSTVFAEIASDILLNLWITALISIFAILSSSVFTLILLCCLDYEFRQCLCQLRKPTHERFDNDFSENENTVKTTPEISFHSSTENTTTNEHSDLVS